MSPLFLAGFLVFVLATVFYAFRLFRERRMLRKTSLFLRVGLISLLLFLALETLKHTSDFPEPLFVLFDSSESMKIEENGLKADEPGQLPNTAKNVILQQFPDREIHAYDLFHFEEHPTRTGSSCLLYTSPSPRD